MYHATHQHQGIAQVAAKEHPASNNPTGGAPIIINQLASDNDIGKLKWRCGFPLENNGTCKQGAAISVTAGTVVAVVGANTSSTISAPTSASSTAIPTSLGSSSATPTQDAANASSTSSADGKCAANHGVAIGAGVGIPLGLAALAMLSLFLRERKMRKAEKSEGDMQRSLQGGHGAYQGSHVVSGVPGGMM
ncbi:hypothetical protein DL95DRAFT_446269 [Leptodontidium sp. 2 PMI_412]|nr:hypothetical protein DL95DRAFT_446269 [Leptodontidium sp. 2 PMI_412]